MEAISLTLATLGALLLLGMLAEALGKRTHVPGVTLLIVFGVAVGPAGLDFLPEQRETWYPLLATVALVMIGFLLGNEFTRESIREHGREVLVISLTVTFVTAFVVTAGLLLLRVPIPTALLLGAIATATAPAATAAVVQELRAKGRFTSTLLGVVAIDDVWGISLFSLMLAVAGFLAGNAAQGELLLGCVREIGGGLLLGVALGVPMAYLTGRLRPGEPTLIEALGFVLLCGGLATRLEVSFLLAAVAMGATVANLARHHERPFREVEHVDRPFLVIFFVLAGATLELGALREVGVAALAYVLLRVLGRQLGARTGARLCGADMDVRRWMGLALMPQAGVALGMALLVESRFPELGGPILPLVIVATVLFELLGPPCTRLALVRVGEVPAGD